MAVVKRRLRALMHRLHDWVRQPGLGWLQAHLDKEALWSIQRRPIAGAVAAGLFAGLMPGPTQMLCAAMLALYFRTNLPLALLCTVYTNPLTIVPLYFLAYRLGGLLLGQADTATMPDIPDGAWFDVASWLPQWLSHHGQPLLLGVPALGLLLALAGYVLVMAGWRCAVVIHWRNRKTKRGSDRKAVE